MPPAPGRSSLCLPARTNKTPTPDVVLTGSSMSCLFSTTARNIASLRMPSRNFLVDGKQTRDAICVHSWRIVMRYCVLLALLCVAASPTWKDVPFGKKTLLLHPQCEPLPFEHLGPFVKRSDGAVLAVDDSRMLVSKDNGKTWEPRALFADTKKYQCRGERTLMKTRDGVLVLAFLNLKEMVLRWDQKKGGPQPGCRCPVYVVRSTDDGETWEEPQKLQDGWCGALRTMIQLRSGRLVLGCQVGVTDPGRHVCFTYASDDEGKTWKKSNVIDLGAYGGYGDHGG
ncbi:MAG: exo-alpha-sialidase, partial [Verrucomicrobia bacterium]|nr:exo-alpha-sialidase [Verrucomicrobiota bacterium]